MSKIAIIVSGTRVNGIGGQVGEWIKPILETAAPTATFTTVKVADFNLPVFDEPILPAMVPEHGEFTKPHSKAWTEEISKYDGYVLLANEYNFGMSGATKNAIDFLYHAWIGKPIMIVSYGILGGTQASEQLKGVLTGMKMRPVETRPALGFHGAQKGPDMFAAAGGSLGDLSKADWDKEKKPEIEKGVKELMTALTETQGAAAA